jgi:transcriptional antiterminator RfaH
MNHMKNWYLIKTKTKQEKIAVFNLENQNYQVYFPCSIINNKNVVLFPGYLFIQLDELTQNWAPVRSTKGVINFVRFGLSYAKISDSLINFIKANEKSTTEKIFNLNQFKLGDSVQINEGVFKNFKAIFKSFESNDRVILLMKIMGQDQTLNVKKNLLVRL